MTQKSNTTNLKNNTKINTHQFNLQFSLLNHILYTLTRLNQQTNSLNNKSVYDKILDRFIKKMYNYICFKFNIYNSGIILNEINTLKNIENMDNEINCKNLNYIIENILSLFSLEITNISISINNVLITEIDYKYDNKENVVYILNRITNGIINSIIDEYDANFVQIILLDET